MLNRYYLDFPNIEGCSEDINELTCFITGQYRTYIPLGEDGIIALTYAGIEELDDFDMGIIMKSLSKVKGYYRIERLKCVVERGQKE